MSHGSLADKVSVWPVSICSSDYCVYVKTWCMLFCYCIANYLSSRTFVLYINCLGQWWDHFKLGMYNLINLHAPASICWLQCGEKSFNFACSVYRQAQACSYYNFFVVRSWFWGVNSHSTIPFQYSIPVFQSSVPVQQMDTPQLILY